MRILKHIPNLLTLANLTAGAVACIFILQNNNLVLASWLVLLGALFDFLDGAAARLFKVSGELGKQLDSLADVITFGLVPSLMAYKLCQINLTDQPELIVYTPLVMAAFSGLRLGKFNIDTRQSDAFIGVPTPANALLWVSLSMIFANSEVLGAEIRSLIFNPYTIVILSAILSLLLVAELPLFAMKFKNLRWKDNQIRFVFVGLSIFVLAAGFLLFANLFATIPIILFLYIILSLINNSIKKKVHEV